MKESVIEKIKEIKLCDTAEELEKRLCPFFEKGGCPKCITCIKSESDLFDCKENYLLRIDRTPVDVWDESFEQTTAIERETQSMDEVVGIGITCNFCYMRNRCPLYKKNYACGIDWGGNKPQDQNEFMDFLISTQYERIKRAATFEKIDGGVADQGLSGEMDRLISYLNTKNNMGRDRLSINVEASGTPSAAAGGGILARLFGGSPKVEEPKAIEVSATDAIEIEEPKKIIKKKKSDES